MDPGSYRSRFGLGFRDVLGLRGLGASGFFEGLGLRVL